MITVLPEMIFSGLGRPKSDEDKARNRAIKEAWRVGLAHGEIKHIWRLMNDTKKISYTYVVEAMNPENETWSPRVAAFVIEYLKVKAEQDDRQADR